MTEIIKEFKVTVAMKPIDEVKKIYETRVIVVLDRSGSMAHVWDDTLGALNSQIKLLQQEHKTGVTFTLIAFDDVIETVIDSVPIQDVKLISEADIYPRSMTALLDAMGKGCTLAKKWINSNDTSTAIVMCLTDGHENASKEWQQDTLETLLKEIESDDKCSLLFLGGAKGVTDFARGMGVNRGSSFSYEPTAAATRSAFATSATSISARIAAYAGGNLETLGMATGVETITADGSVLVE